jgi:hypothetical protein
MAISLSPGLRPFRTAALFQLNYPSESESYVTTDGRSASLSWNKAPIWGLRPDLYYCLTFAGLLMWGALTDERTGLSFAIATGTRQRSNSRVRVRWDSRPYFTVSHLRLPFSSPPTTRRVTVEVFVPASTRDSSTILASVVLFITPLHLSSRNTVPTVLRLLHASSLTRERVYRAVAYKRLYALQYHSAVKYGSVKTCMHIC